MNLNTLSEIINDFNKQIIESGFHRDIKDYVSSLTNNQGNIIVLRDIAKKTLNQLEIIYNSDLPENLTKLFANKTKPFTDTPHNVEFESLLNDTEISLQQFFQKLNKLLTTLNNQIQQNLDESIRLNTFIKPYIEDQQEYVSEETKAIVSILFKDTNTTSKLKEFSKTIQSWNKILPIYHQLLKSESPEDIEIVNVQNGSIDFIVNIDFDIAMDLTELFKVGFKCFMAYLSYKKMVNPIIESYYGNKTLIESEKVREKELINNIGEAVKKQATIQHKKASKNDKKIDTNIDKKIEQVVKLVTSHILKGNDLKLLSTPLIEEGEIIDKGENQKNELKTISTQVRQEMKLIPKHEMKLLLDQYKQPEE